jgi:site-specific DNA-methyltransferase (adenine-specific)
MAEMPDNSVDSIVCDPPYHLTSIVDRFGKEGAAPSKVPEGGSGVYARASRGFMGQTWDGGDVAFQVETWREVWRVLKPGGHLLAFSGSRTYHRMTCAIEDAGFDIRDQIMWVYGSGLPKSRDVSKAIDRAAGAEREVVGPSRSHARADLKYGGNDPRHNHGIFGSVTNPPVTAPATDAARQWTGWGTALKPAHEPICIARKPLQGTVAANVLRHGTGAINVGECRVGHRDAHPLSRNDSMGYGGSDSQGIVEDGDAGRWPANFIHDGSDEATAGLGEAARFFYCAKASRSDREEGCDELPLRTGAEAVEREEGSAGTKSPGAGAGRTASTVKNHHPTVKPTDLMRYLVRMVTPPGGTVLDPFMGSGSTGKAATLEGFNFIGIEMNEDYLAIAQARINAAIPPIMRGTP